MRIVQGLTGKPFETGYSILEQKGRVIVGMSPGNSYFRKETIQDLLAYAAEHFSSVRIMIPDKPAEHTYRALGYEPGKAEAKARLNGNTLQNHSQHGIEYVQKSLPSSDIRLIEWKDEIEPAVEYKDSLEEMVHLYETNPIFRDAARETTKTVIQGNCKNGVSLESAVDEGVKYLLEELAFITASPRILKNEKIAYVYHKRWPIFENLIAGHYDGKSRDNIGFVVVEV